jgi:ferrous iron transport protein B
MYSLVPITAEEQVGRDILFRDEPDVVVHVMDSKNIDRMLPFTLQLLEADFPVIVVLNLYDEARERGMEIDARVLSDKLGVPVIPTVATTGEGIDVLKREIGRALDSGTRDIDSPEINYGKPVEDAIKHISGMITGGRPVSEILVEEDPSTDSRSSEKRRIRAVSMMLLLGDKSASELIPGLIPSGTAGDRETISGKARDLESEIPRPVAYLVARKRQELTADILEDCSRRGPAREESFSEKLSKALMAPLTGIPIFIAVIYLGLYLFVGKIGAGILVDYIEGTIFEEHINPAVDDWLADNVGYEPLRDLIGGDYGIITMAVRYAVAIILPIVGAFFLVFSLIEDSGYLPRLSMLINRAFRMIGLNGRAVIPMVLGFGCSTMATVVTRTQESRRERVLTTFLLALSIPCSAQLGIIVALMEGHPLAMAIWMLTVACVLLLIGYLASKVLPGEPASFFMELPPLRVPNLSNVLRKTYTRMVWYFKEVIPLFVLASIIIWAANLVGLFDAALWVLTPLVEALGLPDDAAEAFLYGFFRRDYGAAGLFDIRESLNGRQLLVASVTLTLFIPCIAQLSVMLKERGKRITAGMVAFIIPFSFGVGFLLNQILVFLNINP